MGRWEIPRASSQPRTQVGRDGAWGGGGGLSQPTCATTEMVPNTGHFLWVTQYSSQVWANQPTIMTPSPQIPRSLTCLSDTRLWPISLPSYIRPSPPLAICGPRRRWATTGIRQLHTPSGSIRQGVYSNYIPEHHEDGGRLTERSVRGH